MIKQIKIENYKPIPSLELKLGVSKHLSILAVREKAGLKLKKAQELGDVEVWSEGEFLKRVKEA